MLQAVLLRVHRWIFVVFALPLAVIIFTGLILSFPPILQTAGVQPKSITLPQVESWLKQYDPENKARGLRIDHFDRYASIQGVGPDGSIDIDLKTGQETDEESWFSEVMRWARPIHEHFVFGLENITKVPIVLISTIGMIFGMLVGVLMGLPRIRNTISGWHKATAWFLLPLLILSPLTGVFMALRISFGEAAPRGGQRASVLEAVRMVAERHDLSGLQSIRSRGPAQMALVIENGARFNYLVSKEGLKPAPSNWPRAFHQGDFLGIWGGVMNVILSLAFSLLLVTGLWIWAKRTFRKRRRLRNRAPAPAQ